MTHSHGKWTRILIATAALAAALGLAACGSESEDGAEAGGAAAAPDYSAAIASAPPRLAELYAGGGEIREGGLDAYERQIAELEGLPIVVNKWASWCGPCRIEFPHFQSQAAEHLDEVAFLGIDTDDSIDAAETFLRDNPVPYPSFADPDSEIADSLGASFFPTTIFYDRDGEVTKTFSGVYSDEQDLAADIEKHALDG